MKRFILCSTVIGSLLIPASALAQDASRPAKPEVKAGTTDKAAKTVQVAKADKTAAMTLTLPVTKLDAEQAGKAQKAISNIMHVQYVCTECDMISMASGMCVACDVELEAQRAPVVKEVKLDAEKGTLRFTVLAGQSIKLSEIDAALAPLSASIDRERLELSAIALLLVTGVGSQDISSQLQTTLDESKLFSKLQFRFDAGRKETLVQATPGAKPAKCSELTALLKQRIAGTKLADVTWTTLPTLPDRG
jgi:hypothetical protein